MILTLKEYVSALRSFPAYYLNNSQKTERRLDANFVATGATNRDKVGIITTLVVLNR